MVMCIGNLDVAAKRETQNSDSSAGRVLSMTSSYHLLVLGLLAAAGLAVCKVWFNWPF